MKIQWIKILFVASLVLSIILRIYLFNINEGLWWDEAVYLGLGKNILKGKYYIDIIASDKESFRCPFLPAMTALSFLINGENLAEIIILIFSIGGIVTTYYLGKTLYNKETGYLAATFLSSFPLYLFFGQRILTESVFVVFFSMSLMTFYLGVEKNKKYLYLCSVFSGLSLLTKYFALILPVFYILYIIVRRKERILLKKEIWIGLALFLLTISPRLLIDVKYYNIPMGGIIKNLEVHSGTSVQPFHFFFINFHKIFGYSVVLIPFGLYFLIKDKTPKANFLILISIIVPLIYFSFSHHKEMRYLVSFSPVYAVCMAYVIKKVKKYEILIIPLLIFLIIQGFLSGYQGIQGNKGGGLKLKEGSLFLKDITNSDEYIMSESSPYTTYYTERVTVRPPKDKEDFYSYIEDYNVTYVLINVLEPGNPDYLLDELKTENFKEVKSFSTEYETVTIYKKL